jgi:hypothetical protein
MYTFTQRPCPCILFKANNGIGKTPTLVVNTLYTPTTAGTHMMTIFPMMYQTNQKLDGNTCVRLVPVTKSTLASSSITATSSVGTPYKGEMSTYDFEITLGVKI